MSSYQDQQKGVLIVGLLRPATVSVGDPHAPAASS
jgi:hypothetical protein